MKTGLAAVTAYALTEAFGLRMGFWAVLSAVIVMQINVADSIEMCLNRFTGTAVGAAIGLAALLVCPRTPVSMTLALFVSVAFCSYMTRYQPRYRMAAITVVIVLFTGSNDNQPLLFSLYRVVEIGLGVGCAFLVSILIWPVRAGAALRARIEEHFARCADLFDTINEAFLSKQQALPPDLLEALDEEVRENRTLLQKALQHERILFDDDTAKLGRRVGMLERCLEHLHTLHNAVNTAYGEGLALIMEAEIRTLARAIEDVMRQFGAGKEVSPTTLNQALKTAETRLQELREEGMTKRLNLRKLLQVMSFFNTLRALAKELLREARSETQASKQLVAGG